MKVRGQVLQMRHYYKDIEVEVDDDATEDEICGALEDEAANHTFTGDNKSNVYETQHWEEIK